MRLNYKFILIMILVLLMILVYILLPTSKDNLKNSSKTGKLKKRVRQMPLSRM